MRRNRHVSETSMSAHREPPETKREREQRGKERERKLASRGNKEACHMQPASDAFSRLRISASALLASSMNYVYNVSQLEADVVIWWDGSTSVGALAHMETMEAFAECFPKGVVNFISGPTLPHAHTHVYAGFGRVSVWGPVRSRHVAWHIKT
jgi:hypothetical protein